MKRKPLLAYRIIASVVLTIAALNGHAFSFVKLIESGQPEPGGTNLLSQISQAPTIDDLGRVSFKSDIRSNGFLQGSGIFLVDGTNVTTFAHYGQPAPDGNGSFSSFFTQVALNTNSQAFEAFNMSGTLGGGNDDTGMFQVISGAVVQLAREGQITAQGDKFKTFETIPIRLNRLGQTAFTAVQTTNGTTVYRSTGANLTRIAYSREPMPGGNGQLFDMDAPTLNNNGQVAFYASTLGSTNGGNDGYFVSDGNTLSVLALLNEISPDGNGVFINLISTTPPLNDNGQTAFTATLTGTTGGTADNSGLYRADSSSIIQLARKGQTVPGGNGRFLDFGGQGHVAINNSGLVAFLGDLTGTTGGATDNAAIYITDGNSITQLARKGQPAPDGNGVFSGFGYPSINNKGQVAFTATFSGTTQPNQNQGIFLVDPSLGIEQVVRSGTLVGGETLSNPEFLDGPNLGGLTGLNQNGQLAFFADLGGNFSIFLWSHPQIQSAAISGSDVLVTVQTLGGTTNFVQATSDLTAGFSDIASVITPGGGLVTTNVLDAGAASNSARFYRVRQLP